ncbi:aminotransferase-like protein [Oryza sativa Japonica Group]|uniref:Aminotransferase-like protein n=1 Tax=Oryza sativa subsp. japonica TaxID=39947 RepID=Q5ZD01_ORYSJ|nr:aminotransferase-like protein [Oryza sativa Japonica Group]
MKFVNRPSVTEAEFPRLEPIVEDDGEERTHCRCTSYGEYASTPADAGAKLSAELLKDWFCSFYDGFQQSSSDKTPSAVGSHHIQEEVQPAAPAIPALADLFSFDIKDYFDETEEETTTRIFLDNLVADCGSIRARFAEIQASILDDLVNTITPAVYLEQHQFKLEKAKQRIADRRERKNIEATIQANQQLVHEEKAKLDQLYVGPIQSNIDRLEARKIDLTAQLEECNAELDLEKQKLSDLPNAIEEQKSRLRSAIKNVADMTKSLKVIPGTDAQDAQAIKEVEQIRQRAVSAIQCFLSQ